MDHSPPSSPHQSLQNYLNYQAENSTELGFWAWDIVGDHLTYCSESYARIMGKTKEEITTTSRSSELDRVSLHPDDLQYYVDAEEQAYEGGVGIDIRYRIITPKGDVRHLHEISEVVRDESGIVIETSGTIQDITHSTQVQQSLDRALVNVVRAERLAKTGTYIWNWPEQRYEACSQGYAQMMGLTVEEVFAQFTTLEHNYDYIHPDDREAFRATENAAKARGEGYSTEYRMLLPTGEILYMREVNEVELDSQGQVIRTMGSSQDITEATLTHNKLRHALAESQRAERMAKLGSYVWNWETDRYESCSAELANMHGLSVKQILAEAGDVLESYLHIHPEESEEYKATENAAIAQGEGFNIDYRVVHDNGDLAYLRESCEVELNSQGGVIRSMGTVQDITEQVLLQDQLHQATKIEAVGQLTGGIAHDFNNMLTVIMGNLELYMSASVKDDPNATLLEVAMDAAKRGATLTGQLLAFARKQSLKMQTLDLQSLITGIKELLKLTLGETIGLVIEDSGQEWLCYTDAGPLESAILNLAINARDAMPDGGSLHLEISSVLLDEQYVSTQQDLSAGPYIQLSIRDTGTGMSREVLAQVFDPFYTTKATGEGTGLGLSIVYGFLKQCRGHVTIDSHVGEGTVVKLYFPYQSGAQLDLQLVGNESAAGGNGELVLIVEDDTQVRLLAVRLLDQLGYKTLEAENGVEALQQLRSEPAIAVLFSDVILPGGMSGIELAEEAWQNYPDLKVLFASGYTRDVMQRRGSGGYELLEKPYSKTQLAHMLNQALVREPRSPS
jgi:signal transduction histidine kinase/CheY-like chemotaxis protein